jgi:Cdc6-like AAA superfamily ATPase
LLRSEEYAKWLTGPVQFFWIHGIPGAGKTVLLSFLVRTIQEHCRKDGNVGMGLCYYYCYFGRAQDETPHLLRWALSQLCRQSGGVPVEVVQLFEAGTEPALATLISAFSAVARSFTMVFLLVDALDETQDQTRLVSTLSCLTGAEFPNVKLLATSRKEPDVERILQKEQSMSLLNPLVDEDIRLYVHETLTSDYRFSGWRPSLVHAVEDSLIMGAKGMFVAT